MRNALWVLTAAALIGATGCHSLNTVQESDYQAMKASGVAVEEKSPGTAAALGVLPGCGSFYTRQYGMGVVDLLLWPYSILWDPIIAYNEAKMINYSVSRSHAKKLKSQQLADLDRQLEEKQISQEEFVHQRRSIETAMNFD